MKLIVIFALLFCTVLADAATVPATGIAVPGRDERASVSTWTPMATGDVGEAVQNPTYLKRSVQATGTFGGATITMQGSNDGTNWATLKDDSSTPADVALTATGIMNIKTLTRFIRPSVTGGAAAAITVKLLIVRSN